MLLKDCKILITRPLTQAQPLYDALVKLEAKPCIFPSLLIEPIAISNIDKQIIAELNHYSGLIFTSQNAVVYGVPVIQSYWPVLPMNIELFAVGAATAKTATCQGWPLPIYPEVDYTSEGLLALPSFNFIENKQFLIVSGEGGRSELMTVLTARGAKVYKLAVYKRFRPDVDITPLLRSWVESNIQIVLSYSGESLTNLVAMLGDEGRHCWLNTPLLVVNLRIETIARNLGYTKPIIVADNASEQAVLAALMRWKYSPLLQRGLISRRSIINDK